jgi:hypothetical protein
MKRLITRPISVLRTVGALTLWSSALWAQTPNQPDAQQLINTAIRAMGGETVLRSIDAVSFKGIGHRYMLEQSERPEGPWLLDYFQVEETRDFRRRRLRQTIVSRGCNSTECWKSAEWSPPSTIVVADHVATTIKEGAASAGRASMVQTAEESLALAPEQVLLLASAASDLRREPDQSFHGFTHHVVSFSWDRQPVRLLLSGYTALPSAVEITRTRPYEFFWSPWGDVTTRIVYAFWMLEPGGLHYPRQWSYESNGQPDWTFMANELHLNPTLSEQDFAIPEAAAKAFLARKRSVEDMPLGLPNSPAKEIAPGVVVVPGLWNVAEIRQPDGIVILDAPISNGYSRQVIEDATNRFPGLAVKAVISTSDAWPHIGGLREYAARGIPIYALDLNKPIVERMLSAPHRLAPDALSKVSKMATVHYISDKSALGKGANALEIIPLRTVTGERQMVVFFPGTKILYSSDLFQRDNSGQFFLPQTLSEAVDVVAREHLDVNLDIGMHLDATPWEEIQKAKADNIGRSSSSMK